MKCKCKDCGSILEMTEGVECPCPRCGYEHTASEVSERIASAKREEAAKHTPKRTPPKPASGHVASPLMRARGVTVSPSSLSARRPASPYVDPFSSTSGKVEKGSSAKAVVLYGAAGVLGIAIITLLAMRISRFVSSPRQSTGSLMTSADSKPVRETHPGAPSATKPVPSERPAPTTPAPRVREPSPQERTPPRWEHPKNWYESECVNAEKLVEKFQFGGYKMTGGSASARSVKRLVAELRRCVARDNPRDAEKVHAKLMNDVREYSAHCVWTKGLRHPKFAHILSGQNVGEWMVEEGYALANPGTADWTVKKVPVAVVCRKCRGSRFQVVSVKCPVCQGRKVLATGGGAQRHRPPMRGRVPRLIPPPVMSIQCFRCGGTGSVQQQQQCSRCQGTGTEFKR